MFTDAARQIAGVKELIEIGGDERVCLRRNGDHGVAHSEGRQYEGEETQQRRFRGTDDAHGSERLVHRNRDIAERRIVHGAVKLVGPGRVGEDALDAEIEFGRGLFRTDDWR